MNRVILILIFGLLSAVSVNARETIKGTVVDSKGEPVPGVKVEIPGSSEFTFTDLDGAFQIILRDPVKNLDFSYPGFGTVSRRVKPEMTVILSKGWNGQTKGFRGMFDIEGGMGIKGKTTIKSGFTEILDLKTLVLTGYSMTFGYQFNRNLFIGAGYGIYLDITRYKDVEKYYDYYSCWSQTELTGGYIPVFLSARWDFGLTKKTAPYIGLRVGYAMYVTNPDYEIGYAYGYGNNQHTELNLYGDFCGALYFSPTIGYRMTLHKKRSMNIGLSYMAGMKKKYTATSYSGNNMTTDFEFTERGSDVLLFNIGIDF